MFLRSFSVVVAFTTLLSYASAQKAYSYINDKKFSDPTDLIGYNFRPSEMEIKDGGKRDISAGAYSFGITQSNLYVDADGKPGVYSVNNINTTDFGYKLVLMNARDPTIQGHLKVIVNKNKNVEALIFLKSKQDKETIFYLPQIPEAIAKKEKQFFTDINEVQVQHVDSLWGKKFRPFMRMHLADKIQERLQPGDSTMISFIEVVTIIDKTKKKDKKDEVATEKVAEKITDVKLDKKEEPKKEEEKKKIKIIKEHFVVVRSILRYKDGKIEDKSVKYEVKSMDEKQDKTIPVEGDRYQLIIKTTKGEELYLYLNGNRNINAMEVEDKSYLARGF
ncbi:MAG: hypothetical protein RLZZ292_261 [Bacteroidota bacterium]|jgi:hypothetical protein